MKKDTTPPVKRKRGRPKKVIEPVAPEIIETDPNRMQIMVGAVDIGFRDDYVVLMGIPYMKDDMKRFYLTYGYKTHEKYTREIIEEVKAEVKALYPNFLLHHMYLPHDAKARRGTTSDTEFKIWRNADLFKRVMSANNYNRTEERIRQFQKYMSSLKITKEFMRCKSAASIIEDLQNASFETAETRREKVKHDRHSHSLDALTYLVTTAFTKSSLWKRDTNKEKEETSPLKDIIERLKKDKPKDGKDYSMYRTI